MIIEADICLSEVFSQITADEILDYASGKVLDEVASKHIDAHWQSKLHDTAIGDFVDLLTDHFDVIALECNDEQLAKIRRAVNGH